MWLNFVHAMNIANHYAMQPTYYNLSVSILYQSYCEYYETRKGRKAKGKSQRAINEDGLDIFTPI